MCRKPTAICEMVSACLFSTEGMLLSKQIRSYGKRKDKLNSVLSNLLKKKKKIAKLSLHLANECNTTIQK